jgi:ribosomal protein S27E
MVRVTMLVSVGNDSELFLNATKPGMYNDRHPGCRPGVDGVTHACLDCGRFESGFARVRCSGCGDEFLVATSCQMRGFCPSCGAKRAAAFGAFLVDEVLEQVGHAMWTFSLPKMIRPYFIHHPELRGRLCRAAFETVQQMMAAAAIGCEGFRIGMVAVTTTAGDLLNVNPHVHAIVPRGGWDSDGAWAPVPYIDNDAAERLFRGKVLSFLTRERLLSEERARVLLSWNHNSGFSIDDSVRIEPEDGQAMERMVRYMLRPPLSLAMSSSSTRSSPRFSATLPVKASSLEEDHPNSRATHRPNRPDVGPSPRL